ncbi:protein kinase MEC1 [Rhodotorula paludigena]|uniref:protein kinase MEC1 n=1 Tax=Rhodotorula paludigena TaxID=86838 RepID=UPI00316FE069
MPGAATQARVTQPLPGATAALLRGLVPAYKSAFPQGAVQPNASEISTAQQKQDAEQRIALLKSVLGGWMQGVELDLDGSRDLAETLENLEALTATIPGSFCGIKAKPRFLLYTSRSLPSATARIPPSPSLVNGTPRKEHTNVPPIIQPVVGVEGAHPEQDLATFLVWRGLSVCSRLQESLLSPKRLDAPAEVIERVTSERRTALKELEALLQGVVEVLSENAVRVEWRGGHNKAALQDGGIGKAREIVEEFIKLARSLIPVTSAPAPAYPRSVTLFEHVRQQQPTLFSPNKASGSSAPHQPTLILRSPLHAFSLVLVCLRTLLVATSSSPYLAGYRAAIVDLLVSTWPANGMLQPVDRRPSHKGKEPAHEQTHDAARIRTALAADWLALACQALDRPVQASAAHECQALAAPVLDELRERLNAPHDDADGMDLDEPAGVVEVRKKLDVILVKTLARLFSRMKGSAGVEGVEEPGASLQQLFLSLLSTDGLKLVQTVHSGNVEVKAAALLALALPLAASSSIHPTDASSPLGMLPLPALRTLDNLLHSHGELPFPDLPVSLRPLSRVLSSAYTLLVADYDATSAEPVEPLDDVSAAPALHPRKRRRLDDVDAAPSSDGAMDVDGMTQPTQVRRRRGPWGEAVNMVLRQAREAIRAQFGSDDVHILEVEGEAAEQTVVRLAAELANVKPGVAVELARTIGLLACARSGCLAFTSPSDIFAEPSPTCLCCDVAHSAPPPSTLPRGSRVFTNDPLEALVAVAPGVFAASPGDKVRLSVLNALARLLKHSALEHAAAQLHNATFNHVVARDLVNSSRSVRLAAGNVILALAQALQEQDSSGFFVRTLIQPIDSGIRHSSPAVGETTMQLVGKLARAAEPQSLLECEALARLIAYYGHSNGYLKSLAKLQLSQTASHRGVKPYALVQPHFAVLSPIILSRPAVLSSALEVFHQSRESLLRITREHTLPGIVLSEQRTLLQQIADASRSSIPEMLCDPPVASSILAHLYMQSDDRRSSGLAVLMRECRGVVLARLIESVNIPLVYKLALELGNEDQHISAQAERALKAVERGRMGVTDGKMTTSAILKRSIVGILSHMNRGLHEPNHQRPLRDKQKIIRSLDAITRMVGRAIAGFSPQIMATLQTALDLAGLRLATLKAFGSFIESLKFSDLSGFIGPTTAVFVRLWPELTPAERNAAADTINYLVVDNGEGLVQYVHDVADLSGIDELGEANKRLRQARRSWTFDGCLRHLLDRVSSENDVVTFQALRELRAFLEQNSVKVQALASGDSFQAGMGRLVEVLLGASVKDGPENELLRNVAFECIGILGAVDPDRFELPPVEQPPIVLENFVNYQEAIDFALRLVQDLLVGAYRSTNDTKHQEFLAYAIQELLRFCGFSAVLVEPGASVDPNVQQRWQRLPRTVVEACAPLLSTRFSLGNLKPMDEASFPIYSSTTNYRDWIRTFANELLQRVHGSDAKQVFGAFSGLLHLEDTVVAQHLLPHLLLNVLICGSEDDRVKIKTEMETVLTDQVSPTHALSENSRLLSAQTVFGLMDHLSRWITLARKRIGEIKALRKKTKNKLLTDGGLSEGLLSVEGILQDIPHILVGQAALTCKAYARSLLNFESHIVAQHAQKGLDTDKDLQVYYENLHECYAHLDEPDGMEGISTKILAPSVLHQIREHESTGRWTSAQSCWEVKLQQKPDDPANHVGLLRCLRNLGHYDTMRTHIVGLLHSRGDEVDWERVLAPFNIEASLFVGDWDSVEDALDIADLGGPEASFGRVLCAVRTGDRDLVERAFFDAREQLGAPVVAVGRESYRRVYDSIVHLHILDEIKSIHQLSLNGGERLDDLVKTLRDRLAATSPSFRAREPILNLRRTAFRLTAPLDHAVKTEVGELWLETSKIARKAGHSQTAYSAILQARDCHAEYAFLQSAKLLKANGQAYKAVQELENRLNPILGRFTGEDENDPLISYDRPSPLVKAALRRARWTLEAGRVEQNEAVRLFVECSKLAPNWESPCYELGHFYDSIAMALEKKQPKHKPNRYAAEVASYRSHVVKLFCKSVASGTKYIYQALPRLLTIWLEMGEKPAILDFSKARRSNPSAQPDGDTHDIWKAFTRTNSHVRKAAVVQPIPAYQWLTVLPQLVSRILHGNDTLFEALEQILIKVVVSYPHHGFWAMASGAKSNTSRRSKRNLRIFQKAKEAAASNRSSVVGPLMDEGLRLVDQLLAMCNYPISGKIDTLSLKKTFPLLWKAAPTKLIIPLQSSLTVSLPYDASQAATHKPFPDNLPVFQEFDDVIAIMSSLQKPRKVTVRGNDGKSYSFLCKPKDDLRKDARLMEFNAMIIKLLKKDSDARSRKLDIRTYSVVPLNEECGLIEWVPFVVVLRSVLNKAYAARGISSWSPELKRTFDTIREDPKRTAERFENEVLSQFPSVFHEWFLENFPEPSSWHRARLGYSRTAAVISMVGFVLGLGDRHCENILLDGTTGDTVHVDFNCLFDKGRTFEVAEKVPFRLTHNIIDGMGVTGVEGVYRRSAEITLRILRANKDSLRSVLETFLHDPLVEWVYVSKKQRDAGQPDQTKARALEALEPISNKLLGLQVTSDPESVGPKEVTVEEQVERLIREARDSKNLGSMYVGWCSWF